MKRNDRSVKAPVSIRVVSRRELGSVIGGGQSSVLNSPIYQPKGKETNPL